MEADALRALQPDVQEAFLIMNDSPYLRDFLRFAIRRSLEAAESYENASHMVIWEEVKTFFLGMAALKRYEVERLQRYHYDGRFNSLERDNGSSISGMTMYMLDMEMKPVCGMEDACRFALKNELTNYQIYMRLADLEQDPVTKELFLFLVELQKAHLQYVQNQLKLAEISSVKEANPIGRRGVVREGKALPDSEQVTGTRLKCADGSAGQRTKKNTQRIRGASSRKRELVS